MKKYISIIMMILVGVAVYAESRNALLIANGKYAKFSSLANPVPESQALAKSLTELGFEVTIVTNASKEDMETKIVEFGNKVKSASGIAFFHYGGHAVQVSGENYLIPADADIPDEMRVKSRAVNVSEIMASMQAETNIVILDCCRNNPLPAGSGRSASRGLMMIREKPRNSVIVYSAEAGKVAADGVFTPILTKKILENKELTAVLRDVRNEVSKQTNDEQTPGQYDQLKSEVYLARNIPSRTAKLEAENAKIDAELERLRAKSKNGNTKEQQEAELEMRRVEAEAKRKQLELEQSRQADARRAEEAKRLAEEEARKNANQKEQDAKFARLQSENAAKLKEIERLKTDSENIEDIVATANQLLSTINEITKKFTDNMNKSIQETETFYNGKRNQIVKGRWETDEEFAQRSRSETAAINSDEQADISKIKSNYQNEIDSNTASLKASLTKLASKKVVIVGSRIGLKWGEPNINAQQWPVTLTDSVTKTSASMAADFSSSNVEERTKKATAIENNIRSGGYVGGIEYGIIYNGSKQAYEPQPNKYIIKELSSRVTVCEITREQIFKKSFIFIGDNSKTSPYYICDHEVTQAEYEAVMGTNLSRYKGDNRPVTNVSWYDAIEYCNKISLIVGRKPYYIIDKNNKDPNNNNRYDNVKWTVAIAGGNGYRLPTEAEWEYAARGADKSRGYKYAGSNNIDEVGWCKISGGPKDVKQKKPNEIGLYDMSGNVLEWCYDWYEDSRQNVKNYIGSVNGSYRVVRSGSWSSSANSSVVSSRNYYSPDIDGNDVGFRVVFSPKE